MKVREVINLIIALLAGVFLIYVVVAETVSREVAGVLSVLFILLVIVALIRRKD